MTEKTRPYLIVREGGRKELGRQLIRAMIEFRGADARAIADRIARRGKLQLAHYSGLAPKPDRADGEPSGH